MLRHIFERRFSVVRWPCGAVEPVRLHEGTYDDAPPAGSRRDDGGVEYTVGPGNRSPGGIAALRDGIVWGDLVHGERAAVTSEWTFRRTDGRKSAIRLPGRFVLRDSRPGVGVLVSTDEPVPHVFLLTEAQVREIFDRG